MRICKEEDHVGLEAIKSKYKNVSGEKVGGKTYWFVHLGVVVKLSCKSERETAIEADQWLIRQGKKPVNTLILKEIDLNNY